VESIIKKMYLKIDEKVQKILRLRVKISAKFVKKCYFTWNIQGKSKVTNNYVHLYYCNYEKNVETVA